MADKSMNIDCETEDLRLFIDSSRYNLKAVLLHNGNELLSITAKHAVSMKETYDNLKKVLLAINYEQHNWQLCELI